MKERMKSSELSSELEVPDGGALIPLKIEIKKIGFPPGIWKILLGDGVVCEKDLERVSSGSCELGRLSPWQREKE